MRHWFDFLFRRDRVEDELDEELRASFEMTVEQYVARGMPPAEARRAARVDFAGAKEQTRDALRGSGLSTLVHDLRYGWRGLRRRPGFATLAVVTLALGIGVNTAIFSVFHAVLMRPLPYAHPEQLALVWASFKTAGTARAPVSGLILGEVKRRNRSLADVAGIWTMTRTFTGQDPEQVRAALVTANFFQMLGARAEHGRIFVNEDQGGTGLMLTNGFFQRRFAGNAGLIGKAVPVQSRAITLVGVLPDQFQLHFAPDVNIPPDVQSFETFSNRVYGERGQYYIRIVARVKPEVSMADAQRDLDRVASEIRAAFTEYGSEDLRFTVVSMHDDAVREVRAGLTALFAGAVFLLLICCVNVASLLLARATERRKEIALRLSLGASRGRILRQLLAEGAVLCALGGAAGVAAGWAGFRGLLAIRPDRFARLGDASLSWPVLAFAAACSLAAAVLFGLAPAIESWRLDLTETLRTGGRGWFGRFQRRAGAALVVGEITLGFILVTGAALTARTLSRIEHAPLGFDTGELLTFQMAPPGRLFLEGTREWESDLAGIPGVQAVGAISHLPLDKEIPNWYGPFRPQGMTERQAATLVSDLRCATPGYFSAMGIRLLEGRLFDDQDRAGGRLVAIVDELLARQTWPGESAVGKVLDATHTTPNGFEDKPTVVVGVVEHTHNHAITRQVRGEIYLPFEQSPRAPLTFVVRSRVDPISLVPAIRAKLRERFKGAPLARVRPMTAFVRSEVAPAAFTAVLAGVFGSLALLLAATGIYGVANYQVSRRLPEMGIRMAMGARGRDLLRLVLGEGLALAVLGVALGAAGSIAVGRWLGTLVYGVSPRDPASFALALVLLPAAALVGCWCPAWRAAGANPAETIREE